MCLADYKLTCIVAKALPKEHIFYQPVRSARDLGITYTAGVLHPHAGALVRSRFTKTAKRSAKIGRLAKLSKRARILFSGSQYAANSWGHQASHLSQSQIDSLEIRGASASGFEAGRCRTFALIVSYGPRGHPVARILKELFSEWFVAVRMIVKLGVTAFNNLRAAFGIARANLADKHSSRVQHCKYHTVKPAYGLMHNVIIWLYKLGWNPMSVDRWVSPDGVEYIMHDLNFPSHLIIFDIVDSYNAIKLKNASKHRNAKGIGEGVDFNSYHTPTDCVQKV